MMLTLMQRLEMLERRLDRMLMVGTVHTVDLINQRIKMQVGELITAWMPWLTASAAGNRSWQPPELGEQCMILAPSGTLEAAYVLPAIYSNAHPAPEQSAEKKGMHFADGAVIEYDRAAHHLRVSLPAGGTITLDADTTINGKLTTTGDTVAGGISLTQHTHSGVQAGGASTGLPQ